MNLRRLSVTFVAVLTAVPAWAQLLPAEEETEPERYVVEVIIFRHMNAPEDVGNPAALREAETLSDTGEPAGANEFDPGRAGFSRPSDRQRNGEPPVVVLEPETSEESPIVVLEPGVQEPEPLPPDAETVEEPEPILVYEPVPEEDFKLTELEERMRSLGAYEPLLHVAWIQEPYPATLAPAFRVDETYAGRPDLTGAIRFSHGRYPHLEFDLSYRPEQLAYQYPDWHGYQLHEYRRMRDGEHHYFDNAHFGAIGLVVPYEPETPEALDDATEPQEPFSAPR
ncbi:MAG: CsiV family protein [Gammaproteobacteria bacterium]